jgi:glucosamine 6-phosphate synthetase-like amidotransferase/phosphosugar isomerase protein
MDPDKLRAKFPGGVLRKQHPFYMADAISDIPGCLDECLSADMLEAIQKSLGSFKPKTIFTVGCGTSYNASQAVSYTLRRLLNIPVYAYDAHDFLLDFPPGVDHNTMVISISESGQSITTCHSQEKARNLGAFTVGISANPQSRLASGANLPLTDPYLHEIPLGKTRTFLSTALLGILAGVMTEDPMQRNAFVQNMNQVVQLMRENMKSWETLGESVASEFGKNVSRYFVTGFGSQKAVSDEIRLKLIEVLGDSATSFGLEEFTHGPSATFRKDLGVILFQTDGRTLEKAVRIAKGITISEASLVVITDQPDADWPQKAWKIALPSMVEPEIFGQFPSAVAAQYLFYYLAIQKGLNPDVNSEDIHPELGDIYAFFFPPGTH